MRVCVHSYLYNDTESKMKKKAFSIFYILLGFILYYILLGFVFYIIILFYIIYYYIILYYFLDIINNNMFV